MGLEEFNESAVITLDTTVSELIDIYGEEAVKRSIKYMDSLSEAEEEFKSVDKRDMERGYKRAFGEDGSSEEMSQVATEWKEAMENKGLGINEDDSQ